MFTEGIFCGRRELVDEPTATLAERRAPVAVLSGPPGVGKCALAVRVAHRARDAFCHVRSRDIEDSVRGWVAASSTGSIMKRPASFCPVGSCRVVARWRPAVHACQCRQSMSWVVVRSDVVGAQYLLSCRRERFRVRQTSTGGGHQVGARTDRGGGR
jgi:DNA polymerase III delta prime subunit